jgi:hypothetical protein
MRFNHRYFWSTRFVAARLSDGVLSEAVVFRYFLAVMAFDWLQFTLIAVTPSSAVTTAASVHAWSTFAVTVLGLVYLYACNGGAAGRDFLRRYFPLSVTVGWKFVAAMLLVSMLLERVMAGAAPGLRQWAWVGLMASLNVALFGRLGQVLRRVARTKARLP